MKKDNNGNTHSFTEVNFRLDEPRVTVGFKCNKKLWKAFVSFSKREFGSVCHILEPIILALLTAQVNSSRTIKPVVIQNLSVERVVKRVRRRVVEDEDESSCWYCSGKAVGLFRYLPSGEVYPLCKRCSEELLSDGKWSVIKTE
ncbi:MAG: hypothetical protein ACKD6O_08255 [Candidatus Bathyarchaeota archaeon]